MTRRIVLVGLLALSLLMSGCSLGALHWSEWADLAQPVVRNLVQYLVCGIRANVGGVELILSPVSGDLVSCSERRLVPFDSPLMSEIPKLGAGAIVEIEDAPVSAAVAELSAENASAAPRIIEVGRLKVARKAPR